MLKKNLKLTLFLFFLLLGFYYFEFYFKRPKTLSDQLIKNSDQITEIKVASNEYVFDGEWKLKGSLLKLDQKKVKFLIKKLSELVILSKFASEKSEEYFSKLNKTLEIKYKDGLTQSFTFGDFSPFSKAFYLKSSQKTKEILMISDQSYFSGTYQNELDLSFQKHEVWRQFFNSHLEVLLDKSLSEQMNLKLPEYETISFENHTNRAFKINLKEQTMTVPPYKGLNQINFIQKVKKELAGMIIKKPVLTKKIILSEKRSDIIFKGDDNEYKLSYYVSLNNQFGHFVKDNQTSLVFEIDGNKLGLFKLNAQSFWDKRIPYNIDLTKLESFQFQVEDQRGTFDFKVNDIDKFEVSSDDDKIAFISTAHMNFLFHLVFNLSTFEQAEYVLQGKETKSFPLKVRLFETSLAIKIERDFIIVYDETRELVFYFSYLKDQIEIDFFDSLFQLKGEK